MFVGGGDRMKAIVSERELEFAIFCIENVARKLNVSADAVYKAFA